MRAKYFNFCNIKKRRGRFRTIFWGNDSVVQKLLYTPRAYVRSSVSHCDVIYVHAAKKRLTPYNNIIYVTFVRPIMDFKTCRIGLVGAGSMGSAMALLFAEHNHKVSLVDIEEKNVDSAKAWASNSGLQDNITFFKKDFEGFAHSFESSKVIILSITHGAAVDEVLKHLLPFLNEGDIIIDGGNEWYKDTQRRQQELSNHGVTHVGMGVSGGYQSARHGPSMSPGGDATVVKSLLPLLEQVAAKTGKDEPCVRYIGPKGAGHYVKMVHNGIEQGMLSILCEAYGLLSKCAGYSNADIGAIFSNWVNHGELVSFLFLLKCSNLTSP